MFHTDGKTVHLNDLGIMVYQSPFYDTQNSLGEFPSFAEYGKIHTKVKYVYLVSLLQLQDEQISMFSIEVP